MDRRLFEELVLKEWRARPIHGRSPDTTDLPLKGKIWIPIIHNEYGFPLTNSKAKGYATAKLKSAGKPGKFFYSACMHDAYFASREEAEAAGDRLIDSLLITESDPQVQKLLTNATVYALYLGPDEIDPADLDPKKSNLSDVLKKI